ncbi:hypothetical protein CMUST_13180 [Corynebacterium mustelae]|uniref:Uncharacterized protein n=1 Tax=Corynebacterium mustelae TaxID=571915 RepID=A0A0G3H2F4_9CORY|nr:hypothetical protein [Corynebacterium mustelae]AKK06930.1 hypothetical protein CMUST_13180 [Corynebacterium mustelae]
MPSTILFDPSFLLSLDFADIDFSVCKADPDFSVDRVSVNGVDYVLVMPNDVVNGGYPESRWTIVDGVVTEMTVHWDSPFTDIDGISVSDRDKFVAEWNQKCGGGLVSCGDGQIWNQDKTISVVPGVYSRSRGDLRSLTYFNPDRQSHKQTPTYFVLGQFDSPHSIERFLDHCVWTDLRRQFSVSLDGWLYLWPGIKDRWPDINTDKAQWLEALDAVMGYVFADGRFEVYDSSTDEPITTVDRFMEATRKFREERDIEAIQLFFFISVAALELRP